MSIGGQGIIISTHLKQNTRDDDPELQQEIITGRIEFGEVDKGQVVVQAVEEGRHAVQQQDLAIFDQRLDQFPERVSGAKKKRQFVVSHEQNNQ